MAEKEKKPILHVEIDSDLNAALISYLKDSGQTKRIAVDRLLRKALGIRVRQIQLFKS